MQGSNAPSPFRRHFLNTFCRLTGSRQSRRLIPALWMIQSQILVARAFWGAYTNVQMA